jgi:hypothetical protein
MFHPDPRIGDRQRACGEECCQRQRRARTQSSWRSRNPSYQTAYRLEKRAATAADVATQRAAKRAGDRALDPPPALRLPAVLAAFPWDFAAAKLGFAGADLLATLALLMVRLIHAVKDERWAETPLSIAVCEPAGRDP